MATPFESFIQTELPKRPFLGNDVSAEQVIVRRGNAPRELQSVALQDGEVLGKVGGVLVGITPTTGVSSFNQTEETPATTWTLTHNQANTNALVTVRNSSGEEIIPDTVTYNANDIVITFANAQSGSASVVFV